MKNLFPGLALLAASIASSSSTAAPAGDAKALQASADRAVVRERFCDAAYLYRKLDEMKAAPENLIAASEAAAGGGDRSGALRFLETFQSRHAGHRLAGSVATKIEALRAAVAKYGAGSACVDPPAECGNGAFESGEDCDDGNRVDADSCPATCKGGGSTTTATPPPPPPPPILPPAKVKPPPPPVKVEPVKPVKVEPVKVEPVKVEPEPEPEVRAIDKEPDEEDEEPAVTPPDGPVAVEPEVKPTPEPPAKVIVDDRDEDADDEDKKVRSIDDEPVEEAGGGGGAPIGGIILAGTGGLAAVAGGVAVGFGLIPFINYAGNVNKQTAVQQDFLDARTEGERRVAAGAAADLRASLVRDANQWNGREQYIALGGGAATAVGIGLLVGGIILVASSGGAPEEDSTEDAADEEEEER
ncbi:MAG: hypothetical protein Q8O67_30800 [Deltaproteobacteria bacterium]|nr:hypothetical protein [Deltaproteobacteria bacterium]